MPTSQMEFARNKRLFKLYLDAFAYGSSEDRREAVKRTFSPDAVIRACHPFNEVGGSDAFYDAVLLPMMRSFDGLHRRDYILMSGNFEGEEWVSSTGYYAGRFSRDWLGIEANGQLAFVREGEFHKMKDGRIVESYIFFDIPEFLMSVGQWKLAASPGYTGMIPGPQSEDGVSLTVADGETSEATLTLVADMLGKLNTPDEAWRPYWHEDMLWYGPAAFGSYIGIEDFAGFQVPFEAAFEGWSGGISETSPGRHFTLFGDGLYACSGGWPSVSGVHVKSYLGFEPTQKLVLMRVCDWWRRKGDLLLENWVFVDIPDLLMQFGHDLFAETRNT